MATIYLIWMNGWEDKSCPSDCSNLPPSYTLQQGLTSCIFSVCVCVIEEERGESVCVCGGTNKMHMDGRTKDMRDTVKDYMYAFTDSESAC